MHHEVQQFYARQMWLLDTGDTNAWVDTFTEDGVFAESGKGDPLVGWAAIAEAAVRRAHVLAGDEVVRRHWLDMLVVREHTAGSVRANYSALSVHIPPRQQPRIFAGTRAQDVLVRTDAGLRVRHRLVSHDGRTEVNV